ncbi:MAG: hypothetical protein HY304_02245 [candidate division Zixibacteria bacterium]|nr:hypothetical protein [candidate division Zixibacteria bacterium]
MECLTTNALAHYSTAATLASILIMATAIPAHGLTDSYTALRLRQAESRLVELPRTSLLDERPASLFHLAQGGEFGREDRDRINVTRAAVASLLLPGAGQWYAGARTKSGFFLAGEAAVWTMFDYFHTVGNIKHDDYRDFAVVHAGIDPDGKGDDFYRTITFYDSREDYNDAGRLVAPGRPFYEDTPYWDWQWDSPASMQRYRTIRNQSNEAHNRAKFVLGAAVLHRLVSAVDAWRTARSVNHKARMETGEWKVRFKGRPDFNRPSLMVLLTRQL